MPSYKAPTQFPGVTKLPKALQSLVELMYPPDQIMPKPLDFLNALLPRPLPTVPPQVFTPEERERYAKAQQAKLPPWKQAAIQGLDQVGEQIGNVTKGLFSDPTQPITTENRNPAYAIGALAAATPFAHNIKQLRRIASGVGRVPLYHGTTADNAVKILQEGFKPLPSGAKATERVAELYKIPLKQWRKVIERGGLRDSGYGAETANVSMAPFGIAERWSSGFPQGEVLSDMNSKARIFKEAQKRGMRYADMYNHAGAQANKQGMRAITKYPDAIGAEDLMRPKRQGGVVIQGIVNAADIPSHIRQDALSYLRGGHKPNVNLKDMLRFWEGNYIDIKIAPSKIKRIRIVKGSIEGPEG